MNRYGKPSIDDILALDKDLTIHYGPLHKLFERDEAFYELNFKDELDLPKEFASQGVVLPTARGFVDTFVDNIDIIHAKVRTYKKGLSKKLEEESQILRQFALGILHMTELSADISQWRVAGKHYAGHGLGALATFWDADMWPDKPIQKDDESEETYAERIDQWREETHLSLPIVIKAVHPHNLLPDPSTPRQFIIEKSDMIRIDAEKFYPWWKNPQQKKITENVVRIDYWDKDWHCVLVDTEPVLRVRGGIDHHRYGFIPYVLIESGMGNLSYQNKPEMRYVGILRYIYELLISDSRNYSIADVILSKTAWGGGFLENTGNPDAEVKTVDQGNFGTWQQLPLGIKAVTVTPQVPPDALLSHAARTSFHLQSYAAPNTLRGMPEAGVRSAVDREKIATLGRMRYAHAAPAFNAGAAKVLINCAKLFKNVIPGDVTVWFKSPSDEFDYYTIKKEQLKEPFNLMVEFSPVSGDDEYKRNMNLEQLRASGLAPVKWIWKQMPNVDPKEMELEFEKEKLNNDPGLQQMISAYAQSQLTKAIQSRIEAEQLKEGGIPPTAPAPPSGPGMLPMGTPGVGASPSRPLETGGRMIPPSRQVTQPGSAEDLNQAMAKIAPPRPKLAPLQGMMGGGNRP